MRRTGILLATPLLLLAGCTAGQPSTQPSPTTASASPTLSASPAAPSTEAATTSAAAASTTRCHTADLKVTLSADEGGGAAGTAFETIVFTNTSTRTCTLYGYPGVSFVTGDKGTQVGDAFTRTDGTKATITLTPGEQAHASIGLPQTGNFPVAACKPVKVRGFRVYPPDETAAVFVSQSQPACSLKGQGVGQVLPVSR